MRHIKAYHGSNARFSQFEQSKARIVNDFYGGGVAYFTDELSVAKSYASSMFRKHGGERYVYEVGLRLGRIFDVDDTFTSDKLLKLVGRGVEQFARGAGLLRLGADRATVLGRLREGSIELTGEQVFKGLSNGMTNTARTRAELIKAGYDGLRYNGGLNMGMATKHNVYLVYNASDIEIKKRYIVTSEKVPATAPSETYTFIN